MSENEYTAGYNPEDKLAPCIHCKSERVCYLYSRGRECCAFRMGPYQHQGYMPSVGNNKITDYGDGLAIYLCMDCLKLQLDGPLPKCIYEYDWPSIRETATSLKLTLSDGSEIEPRRIVVEKEEEGPALMWDGHWRQTTEWYCYEEEESHEEMEEEYSKTIPLGLLKITPLKLIPTPTVATPTVAKIVRKSAFSKCFDRADPTENMYLHWVAPNVKLTYLVPEGLTVVTHDVNIEPYKANIEHKGNVCEVNLYY